MSAATTALTPAQRIEQANLWTVEAAPVIRAWLAMDQVADELAGDGLESEARAVVERAMRSIRALLNDARDAAISDETLPHPDTETATDAEWDAYNELCDEMDRAVTTVDTAISKVEREQ